MSSISSESKIAIKETVENAIKDYHSTILPYLGGMPEMVANKFSKGDMYSTDEKMIGQWIDGKPLYQRVIEFTTPSSNTETVINTDIINASDTRIIYGYVQETGSANWSLPIINYNHSDIQITLDGSKIYVYVEKARYQNKTCYLVIQYTKTTDSAVAIGDDTDYSTTEKIVGTWIDGKPIWQKTIDYTGSYSTGSHTIVSNILSEWGIDTVCNIKAMMTSQNRATWVQIANTAASGDYLIIDTDNLIFNKNTTGTTWSICVTLQYTKTS